MILLLVLLFQEDPAYGRLFARTARELAQFQGPVSGLHFPEPDRLLACSEIPPEERSWSLPEGTPGPARPGIRAVLGARGGIRWDGAECFVDGGPSFRADRPGVVSPDGKTLHTLGPDGRLTRHSLPDGKVEARLPADPDFDFRAALSPDARLLLRGSRRFEFKLLDATDGALLLTLPPRPGRADAIAFSPDGALLAIASLPGVLEVWDLDAGVLIRRLAPLQRMPASAAFDPSGRTLALSAVEDPAIDLITLSPFRTRLRLSKNGHGAAPWALAFSPDGRTLASGDLHGKVLLWPVAPLREEALPAVPDADVVLGGDAAAFQDALPALAADPATIVKVAALLEVKPESPGFAAEATRPAVLGDPLSIRRMRALRILARAAAIESLRKVAAGSTSTRERAAARFALDRR
jgi:WD40 repeat protein